MDVLKEKDVLKPAPQEEESDDWPCYILNQAVIFSQDEKSMVNLLEAELHGPFLVRGKLEVEKESKFQLLCNPRGRIVEVSSDMFSIGEGPDGQVIMWAGGCGRWFEIRPSVVYREEYDSMSVGVKLYYSIVDCITEAKQSRKNGLDVDKIFDAYSAKETDSALNREDVAEICKLHGGFLLSMMRRPAARREWETTSIYKWLVQELPDIIPQLNNSSRKRASRGPHNAEESSLPDDNLRPRERKAAFLIRQTRSLSVSGEMDQAQLSDRSRRRPATRGNTKTASVIIDLDTDIEARPLRSRRSGKRASLRLATPGKRLRSASIPNDDQDDDTRSQKRRRSVASNIEDNQEDTPMDDAPDEDEDEEEEVGNDNDNDDEDEDEGVEERLQLGLDSVSVPCFEPVGPDGLWKCPRKGCKYCVYGVEDEGVQEQIRKHFLRHAENINAQLARFRTVKQESRPHLPINHLLEKLRSLGEASRLQEEEEEEEEKIEGKSMPKPIKRKIPV